MADGVLDELLRELKQDIKVRLLERLMRDDLSKYDKALRKATDEVFAELLSNNKDERSPFDAIRRACVGAMAEWAAERTKELLAVPQQQKELGERLKVALDDALRKCAEGARFEVSVRERGRY